MTKYPSKIDTDADLPRVDDNLSEMGSDTINAMREAIIAIQRTIGENPQGTTANLVSRISQVLNDDGTLKASALIAAGLIALPITNSQISATAAIEEAKLDLDYATQSLQDQIWSNDIDIANLQKSIYNIANDFALHVAGNDGSNVHDAFDIVLSKASPGVTPPSFVGLTATEVGTALIQINNKLLDHISTAKIAAHLASNISVDNSNMIHVSATDTQTAIEQLDKLQALELEFHRDEMHANGFSKWANNIDGYNVNLNKVAVGTAYVYPLRRSVIKFSGTNLSLQNVKQGDMVVLASGTGAGQYVIDDVGARPAIGSKGPLQFDELEIVGTFANGFDGYVSAGVFGERSIFTYKTNVAPTIHQSDLRVDSIQCARPRAAKVLSLGADPKLLDSTHTFSFDVGTGFGAGYRTVTITDLNKDRNGIVQTIPTLETVVERINYVLQNRLTGLGFPAAAYKVGDELMISHNWVGSNDYYIKINSTGTANLLLGFDNLGANVVDLLVRPTQNTVFYVGGKALNDFKQIVSTTANVSGQTFTFSSFNPLAAGVKEGHLIHLKTHSDTDILTSPVGTYFIISVTNNSVTVQRNPSFITATDVEVEILNDAVAINEFSPTSGKDKIIEIFSTSDGALNYNERLAYTSGIISNLKIADVSDNSIPGLYSLISTSTTSGYLLSIGSGKQEFVPSTFSGIKKIYLPSNVESLDMEIIAPVGAGTISDLEIKDHINEEEVLEICSFRLSGSRALGIVDKRLFGHIGLDEIREDIEQALVETPLDELRSGGVVRGFDIISSGFIDPAYFPSNEGVLIRGGFAYVGGVRVSTETRKVMFDSIAGTFYIVLNPLGNYSVTSLSLEEILDGYGGAVIPIAKVLHSGSTISYAEDARFFINNIDNKIELSLDLTNRMVGTFSSVEAALDYVEHYPYNEKFKVRILSHTSDNLVIDGLTKDITLVIDGSINNLLVNVPCKIVAESRASRQTAHIKGSLQINAGCSYIEVENLRVSQVGVNSVTSGDYKFTNCYFDGGSSGAALAVAGSEIYQLSLEGCTFAESSGILNISSLITVGQVNLKNCTFIGGSVDKVLVLSADSIQAENCLFDRAAISHVAVDKSLIIDNCIFKNLTTAQAINSLGALTVTNSIFKDIDTPNFNIVECGSANSVCTVSNSQFKDILSLQANDKIVSILKGSIANCSFERIEFPLFPGEPCLVAPLFNGNTVLQAINQTSYVAAEVFTNNIGFHTVTSYSSIGKLRNVSDSQFDSTTIGRSIDLSSHTALDFAAINGNSFSITSGYDGILFGSDTTNVSIVNNIFNGNNISAGAGIALTSANAGIIIEGNIFNNIPAFSNTSAIDGVRIVNNNFGAANTTLILGDNCEFSHNYKNAGTFILSGTITNTNIISNTFDNTAILEMQLGLTSISNSVIFGNSFASINFSPPQLTEVIFSGNNCSLLRILSDVSTNKVLFKDNILNIEVGTNFQRIQWANSFITENIFKNSDTVIFKLATGTDANCTVAKNIFNGSVSVNASGSIAYASFEGNVNISIGSQTLAFLQNLNKVSVINNLGFAISLANGMNQSFMSGNMLPEDDISLSGVVLSSLVSNNACGNIHCSVSSLGGLNISNNFINSKITILGSNLVGTNHYITKMVVSNNVVLDTIEIACNNTNIANIFSIRNSEINSNKIGNSINIFKTLNSNGAQAFYEFLNNTVSFNIVENKIEIYEESTYYTGGAGGIKNSTISNNIIPIIGNTDDLDALGKGLYIHCSRTSSFITPSTNPSIIDSLQISNNALPQLYISGNFELNNVNINNNTIGQLNIRTAQKIEHSNANVKVQSNLFYHTMSYLYLYCITDSGILASYSGLIIDNNTFTNNGDMELVFNCDSSINNLQITKNLLLFNSYMSIEGRAEFSNIFILNNFMGSPPAGTSLLISNTINSLTPIFNMNIVGNYFAGAASLNISASVSGNSSSNIFFIQNVFKAQRGISILGGSSSNIKNITVSYNKISYIETAQILEASSFFIFNNTISDEDFSTYSPLSISCSTLTNSSILNNAISKSGVPVVTVENSESIYASILLNIETLTNTQINGNLCIKDILLLAKSSTSTISSLLFSNNLCDKLYLGGTSSSTRFKKIVQSSFIGNFTSSNCTIRIYNVPNPEDDSLLKNQISLNYINGLFSLRGSSLSICNVVNNIITGNLEALFYSTASSGSSSSNLPSVYQSSISGNLILGNCSISCSNPALTTGGTIQNSVFNSNVILDRISISTEKLLTSSIIGNTFQTQSLGVLSFIIISGDGAFMNSVAFCSNFVSGMRFDIYPKSGGTVLSNCNFSANVIYFSLFFDFYLSSSTNSSVEECVFSSNMVNNYFRIQPAASSSLTTMSLSSCIISNNQSEEFYIGSTSTSHRNKTTISRTIVNGNQVRTKTVIPTLNQWTSGNQSIIMGNFFGSSGTDTEDGTAFNSDGQNRVLFIGNIFGLGGDMSPLASPTTLTFNLLNAFNASSVTMD